MKQLQSQMEAEMRMKTELVRHQMQILSEVQSDSDFNEVISRFAGIIAHSLVCTSNLKYSKKVLICSTNLHKGQSLRIIRGRNVQKTRGSVKSCPC